MTARLAPSFLKVPLAHRALHDVTDGRPENSRAAISAAISAGYGIEIDVQLSRDEQAMVFHDVSLNRLTPERGPVRQRASDELQAIPLTGGSEGIPSLSEILELVAGRVPLLVEIKDQDGAMGPNVGILEKAVSISLIDYDGLVAVMSFNPHSVACMKNLLPDVPRGIVTSGYGPRSWGLLPKRVRDRLRDIPDFERCEASFISHEVSDLDRPRVANLKAAGADILCWTITSPKMEAQARRVAQNITFEQYLPALPA